jgi:hypothetical protein
VHPRGFILADGGPALPIRENPAQELMGVDWLGTNLIASACAFEVAAAQLIASEAGFIDEMIHGGASVCELLHANQSVCSVVHNLRYLEEAIVDKIHKGANLPPAPEPPGGGCVFGRPCACPHPGWPPCRERRQPDPARETGGCGRAPRVFRRAGCASPPSETSGPVPNGGGAGPAPCEGEREP